MCLAAISLLCAPFVAGVYSPAVLAWISGAASITDVAVPVAICATFVLVAVTSAIYLLSLIISSAKKAHHSEEKFEPIQQKEHMALQEEPQKGFGYNDGSDNVGHDEVDGGKKEPVPVPLPLTFGTAIPQLSPADNSLPPAPTSPSGMVPPPPPPPPPGGMVSPPPPPPQGVSRLLQGADAKKPDEGRVSLLDAIRNAGGKPKKSNGVKKDGQGNDTPKKGSDVRANLMGELKKILQTRTNGVTEKSTAPQADDNSEGSEQQNSDDEVKQKRLEELAAKIEEQVRDRRERIKKDSQKSNPMAAALASRFKAIHTDSSSSSDSEQSWSDSEDQTTHVQPRKKVLTKKREEHKKPHVPSEAAPASKAGSAHETEASSASVHIAKPRTRLNVVPNHVNSETRDGRTSTPSVKKLADLFGGEKRSVSRKA